MKVERMHTTDSSLPHKGSRHVEAESKNTVTKDAVSLDGEKREQKRDEQEQHNAAKNPKEEPLASRQEETISSEGRSIDVVV